MKLIFQYIFNVTLKKTEEEKGQRTKRERMDSVLHWFLFVELQKNCAVYMSDIASTFHHSGCYNGFE